MAIPHRLNDVTAPDNAPRARQIKDTASNLALNSRGAAADATVLYGLLDLAGQLEAATFHGAIGGRIEIPGMDNTPFTKAVVDAYTNLNLASGDGAPRADIAQNGVYALINGLQMLEVGFQQLGVKVAELEKKLAQRDAA